MNPTHLVFNVHQMKFTHEAIVNLRTGVLKEVRHMSSSWDPPALLNANLETWLHDDEIIVDIETSKTNLFGLISNG